MSRRTRLAIPLAVALLAASARTSHGDPLCVMHGDQSPGQRSITGELVVDRGEGATIGVGAAYGFSFSSSDSQGWSPIGRGDAVDATFSLVEAGSDRPTLEVVCHRASFAAISAAGAGARLPLRSLCGAVSSDAGPAVADPSAPNARLRVAASIGAHARAVWLVFDLAAIDATASGAADLDANGEGTASFTVDLPATTLTTTAILDANDWLPVPGATPVTIELGASQLRGTTTFVPRSDACPPSSGGCDCGGPAGGWRPGGG
jgi:hypothetical protein